MKALKTPILFTLVMIVICGLAYPLATTGLAQILFPVQANGNLIDKDGNPTTDVSKAVGSDLIGQQWTDKRFMKGRPSAVNYNVYKQGETLHDGLAESGSDNFSNSNPEMEARVAQLIAEFITENAGESEVQLSDIPSDLFTQTGSGLDPHISPEAAAVQIPRLVKNTGLSKEKLEEIVKRNTSGKLFGIFGQNRVNVLRVNLEIARELNFLYYTQ